MNIFLYQTSASTKNIKKKWKDRKKSYKNNKFKIIYAPTQNETFELPDGLYSVSNIQDCFKHIIKKHETVTHNPPIRISVNKIKDKITFKIKTGYYLKRLTPETIKLLGNAKNKITEKKIGGNMPYLEITQVVLVHCNVANNDYQNDSRDLHTFLV